MATSFSGGRSRSTRREPPTMGKQLVNFVTCGCDSFVSPYPTDPVKIDRLKKFHWKFAVTFFFLFFFSVSLKICFAENSVFFQEIIYSNEHLVQPQNYDEYIPSR
jgi:hypothetical protein